MPTKRCCCGPGCIGCCFPYEENFQCQMGVFGRRAKVLAWGITAPNCPSLNGLTGTMSPETTCPHDTIGPCGNCLCYVNSDHAPTFILGSARFDNGGICGETPCGLGFCFNLTCNIREPVVEGELLQNCCNRIKLLVMIKGAGEVTGGNPVDLGRPNECLDVAEGNYVNFFGCPGGAGETLLYLDPISCTCEDEADGEFEVVYDLSEIAIGCGTFFPGGHICEGFCQDCMPTGCDLTDAVLVVVKGEP